MGNAKILLFPHSFSTKSAPSLPTWRIMRTFAVAGSATASRSGLCRPPPHHHSHPFYAHAHTSSGRRSRCRRTHPSQPYDAGGSSLLFRYPTACCSTLLPYSTDEPAVRRNTPCRTAPALMPQAICMGNSATPHSTCTHGGKACRRKFFAPNFAITHILLIFASAYCSRSMLLHCRAAPKTRALREGQKQTNKRRTDAVFSTPHHD